MAPLTPTAALAQPLAARFESPFGERDPHGDLFFVTILFAAIGIVLLCALVTALAMMCRLKAAQRRFEQSFSGRLAEALADQTANDGGDAAGARPPSRARE
ncbi:9bf7794b-962f-4b13-b6a4-9a144b5382a8 [Thermothielavioides terrestris]|uniref:9bf7794b-962f-4b13-b6a4-9a144b5382a8 n=1 Tax=Thermothielavioides terrestris TaxID=2587410 RepID=A0A3S4AVM6_9PEZI|nr:9bf7794b-962f-4b13-b6a4-9a144b5382a8 [Thermothielavioides terrestris]